MRFNLGKLFSANKDSGAKYGKRLKYDTVVRLVDQTAEKFGKELCLDIGAGNVHDANYTSTDIDPKCEPDIVVDLRVMFAASDIYRDMREDFPDAEKIGDDWNLIRMIDVVEHVEWIYQRGLYQWLYSILTPGGLLFISTPNLEYAARLYVENLSRVKDGLLPAFPRHEHGTFKENHKPYDITRYFNFKIHSGCSWMDYHHSTLDKYWLISVLGECGFADIKYFDAASLYVLAKKPVDAEDKTVEHLVDDVLSQWKEEDHVS